MCLRSWSGLLAPFVQVRPGAMADLSSWAAIARLRTCRRTLPGDDQKAPHRPGGGLPSDGIVHDFYTGVSAADMNADGRTDLLLGVHHVKVERWGAFPSCRPTVAPSPLRGVPLPPWPAPRGSQTL